MATFFLLLASFLSISITARCDVKALNQEQGGHTVRQPVFAGSWYEGTEERLKKQVDDFLAKAQSAPLKGAIRGLISPHAGYTFSGPTAAVGYKTLRGCPVRHVMVLAPSHRHYFHGASIAPVTHYATPLGLIPLDRSACDKIVGLPLFSPDAKAHSQEHSLEIQLPFLQQVLEKGWTLIPIVIGDVSAGEIKEMSAALAPYWTGDTIVVASSDFTHYGASFGYFPFREPVRENLAKFDGEALNHIEAVDPEGFSRFVSNTGATICGHAPIELLLWMARSKGYALRELYYTTSGEITGDYSSSVSYASVAVLDFSGPPADTATGDLSHDEKACLLRLARDTLSHYVTNGEEIRDLTPYAITDNLKADKGVFVTLTIDGRLRGCIGYLQGRGPLYRSVIQNTVNAAAHDPRFPPVTEDEVPKVHIEISVLGPVVRVNNIEEIAVGRDGLIVTKGYYRGTLLPQVAKERNWSRTEFLENTCLKAGLSRGAYKEPDTTIERYAAQVFGEPAP